MAKYSVRMVSKIQQWWEEIRVKSDFLINKGLSKLSEEDKNNKEKLIQVLKQLRQKNLIVKTVQDFEDLLELLEENRRPLPAKFASKSGEIISNLGYKIGNKEVEVHHGHVNVMNKLNTLYWIHSPKDNKIIILALLEEHPKNNRGYSKKELLKRLPKNIPDDLLNSENEDSEENYSQKLKISDLGKLTRVSTNRFKIGAIYRDEKRNYYLFFKIDNNSFIFLKLDDLTKDKELLSSSSILDLLDYHKDELFQYNKEIDSITKIEFLSAKKSLNKNLYISYNSDESIKELLIMINESILLIEIYNKGFEEGKNSISNKL